MEDLNIIDTLEDRPEPLRAFNYFTNMINSPSYNLKNIYRYSNCHLINQESTAEHTMLMQLMAIHIYNLLKEPGFDLKEVIYRIALHDLDECVLCDIPRDIKYHNEDSYKLITEVSNDLLKSSGFKPEFVELITNAKHDHLEGELVGYLDVLQAVSKIYTEYKLQGTYNIHIRLLESIQNLSDRFKSMKYLNRDSELGKYLELLTYDTCKEVGRIAKWQM